jgi:magnesium transporter
MAANLALSELLGLPVYDPGGKVGSVREVAIVPQEDQARVAALVVRTADGDRLLASSSVESVNGGVRSSDASAKWGRFSSSQGMLLLERDLLDQQIIDINGRKVVRVNDIDLVSDVNDKGAFTLKIANVDAGARGAVRRLLKGVVPRATLSALVLKIKPRYIPWDFVNLIETDPARRIHLKISSDRLERLHPADIADIIEDLSPAERDAVFQGLDEEVAAHALEEIEPRLQVSLVNSMEDDRAADIVEEMDPDAAADLLNDLSPERSEAILEEMEPAERQEVEELLDFKEDTAAGRMTTDYMALPVTARVVDAIELLRTFEGGLETVSTVFLVGERDTLVGAVPLVKLVLAPAETALSELTSEPLISCSPSADENEVAELFDKYNLLTLPVVNSNGALTGVITADDVISILRGRL